jgi:hypothetical protein
VRLDWLPSVLRSAGLTVVEVSGWKSRGYEYSKVPRIFIYHHTAENRNSGNAGGLGVVTHGRTGLPGPIANLYLGRNGTVYVVASGVSNNAGRGNARAAGLPSVTGNGETIAIEMANNGVGEPYAPVMYTAAVKVGAAIARHLNLPTKNCIGHKEWSTSGKIDPTWNMNNARADITAMRRAMDNPKPVPAPSIPTAEEDEVQTIVVQVTGEKAQWWSFGRQFTRWIVDPKMKEAGYGWDQNRLKQRYVDPNDKDNIVEVPDYATLFRVFGPPQPGTEMPPGVVWPPAS